MDNKFLYTNLLIKTFTKQYLSEYELIKFLLSDNPTQCEADRVLENVDIENLQDNLLLVLAYFCKLHPEIILNECVLSKIKVVKDFYMKKRMELYVHSDKYAQKYNDIKEIPMLLKGGLMSYLNPELLRTMNDIDILVSENAYKNTPEFAKELGYTYCKEPHSYDLHEKNSTDGALDVHRYIYMDTKCEKKLNKNLWERSVKINFLERNFAIPCDEDILFISLVNFARNLRNATSMSNILFTFFDCRFILKRNSDFNWKILFENAKLTNTLTHLYFSLFFIKSVMPSFIPDNLLKPDDENIKKLEEYSAKVYYNRIFLDNIREECRALKLGNIFKSKSEMFKYLSLKPKYILLKSVKDNMKIIRFLMKKSGVTND